MTFFFGTNDEKSTIRIAMERAKYRVYSFGGNEPKMIKDLNFAEMNFYGRIDTDGRSIHPRLESLVNISNNVSGEYGIGKMSCYPLQEMFYQSHCLCL